MIQLSNRDEILVAGGCDHGNPITAINLNDWFTGQSRHVGNLLGPRSGQSALLTKSHQIYIIGGSGPDGGDTKAVEVFNLATGKNKLAGTIAQGRCAPSLTELRDGRILVAGGRACKPYPPASPLRTIEVYDPRTGTSRLVAEFHEDRQDPTLTPLIDGRVLFTGGANAHNQPMTEVEIFDPKTNKLSSVGSMPRCDESIVPLADGKVLFAGGIPCSIFPGSALNSAEVFDLTTNRFEKTGDMVHARIGAGLITLRNGKILFAGGSTGTYEDVSQGTAELYDPEVGKFTATGNMTQPRTGPSMTMRPDGTVLLVDGAVESLSISVVSRSSEIYDPASGRFVGVARKAN